MNEQHESYSKSSTRLRYDARHQSPHHTCVDQPHLRCDGCAATPFHTDVSNVTKGFLTALPYGLVALLGFALYLYVK